VKRIARQFVLEWDDHRYRLTNRELRSVPSLAEVSGDKWVVSDFEGAIPQVMTVDAPMKYVDAVIEKRLRESGALVGGGRVLVLRKHRRGSRATEALFVPVPSGLYARYAASAEDDEYHQPLFALHMLLSRELDRLRSKTPVALLLIHDRHADVVVGDARRTYGAFRASWHRSGGGRARLIENLVNGLRSIEQEHNIRVKNLNCHFWLLEQREDADWTGELAKALEVPLVQADLKPIQLDGQRHLSSVPALLANLAITDSVSTPTQKASSLAQDAIPWAAAAFASIALVSLAATFYWSQRSGELTAEAVAIENSLLPPEPAPAVLKAAYEKPLALADMLGRAQISPSVQRVLAEISASVSGHVTFTEVSIEYPDDRPVVALTLIGQSEKSPDSNKGVPALNTFIDALRQRGYTLVSSELQSDINAFSFLAKLERGLK
jgi:hypothetical protein